MVGEVRTGGDGLGRPHSMGLDNAWKHFGPEIDPGIRALHKASGRRGILEGGLRGGDPGRPPFWRTLVSPTEWVGMNSGVLKNKHSTHTHTARICQWI